MTNFDGMVSMPKEEEKTKKEILTKLLGPDLNDGKLKLFSLDNPSERIGNFGKLQGIANDIYIKSKDYTACYADLTADSNDMQLLLNIGKQSESEQMFFSNNGLSGLCTQLDIPTAYIRKCLVEGMQYHAAEEMNMWLDRMTNPKKEILLRTTDHRVHGVLSDRYSVFDDHEVLEIAENILGDYDVYTVKNYFLDPEYMKVRIVSRDKIDIGGRPLSFGFDIRNSRVGRSSIELNVIIFDHICSNGMIMGGGQGLYYQRRHVGINRTIFMTEFTNMLNSAPNAVEFIRKSINAAYNERVNSDSIQRYLDKFKANNMSRLVAGKVEQMFHEKYDSTLFGFAGAITETAQQYGLEMRERMEKFAGDLIYNFEKRIA